MSGKSSHDPTRDPCPYIIVYDIGFGFALGGIGSSFYYTYKGYRNSPRGERMFGIVSAIKSRAPITAGNFAVWSGMFNACDCALASYRGKEDTWNPIMAGAATGAILAARSGPKTMVLSGVIGGIFLAAMEGVGGLFSKYLGEPIDPQPIPEHLYKPQPAPQPKAPEQEEVQQPKSLFKGRFGIAQ
ncbi:Tim17/Tim22/Tim23/Pmp24 family-domain-containing protein [Globomyces pollinis-pini]|nr:Tim17/Tim22/Tim23/Pmp24 family-domain-containing protein [Globomyces pollinis-pini]